MVSFVLFPWPSHRSDRHPSLQHGCQLVLKTSRAQHPPLVDMIPHGLYIGLTERRMNQSLRGLTPRRSRGASSQIHRMVLDASMTLYRARGDDNSSSYTRLAHPPDPREPDAVPETESRSAQSARSL